MGSDSLYNLYRTDKESFLKYQSQQGKDVFKGIDFIVSFVGEGGLFSRFIGVFKILDCKSFQEKQYRSIDGLWYLFEYDMEEVNGFDELKDRVIVKWNKPISWHQWIKNDMEVVEIQPGLHYETFKDYFDVILNFRKLEEIIQCQYSGWEKMLSAVKGIYLITDTKTGKLYVGSAYNENGIWGRWTEYVKTNGHGGNKDLIALVNSTSDYARDFFQFSILMILPKTTTNEEAIKKEQLFKRKLGTNSYLLGLNNN